MAAGLPIRAAKKLRGETPDAHLQRSASRPVPAAAARSGGTARGGGTSAPRCGAARLCIRRRHGSALAAVAGDVEEHLLQILAPVARRADRPGCRDRRCGPVFSISTSVQSRSTSAMLCEASRIGAAAFAAVALQPGAHQIAGVGIEAGGRLVQQQHAPGRLISDFASATRVFCPADSSPAGRFSRSCRSSWSASSAMRRSSVAHVVEVAVDAQVLAPPTAGAAARRRARRNSSAPARRSGRAPCRGRACGCCRRWGSAGRAAWRSWWSCRRRCRRAGPTVAPARHGEADVVDRQRGAVALGQVLHDDNVRGGVSGDVPRGIIAGCPRAAPGDIIGNSRSGSSGGVHGGGT